MELKKETSLVVLIVAVLNGIIFRDASVNPPWKVVLSLLCIGVCSLPVVASILTNINDGLQEKVVEHA